MRHLQLKEAVLVFAVEQLHLLGVASIQSERVWAWVSEEVCKVTANSYHLK